MALEDIVPSIGRNIQQAEAVLNSGVEYELSAEVGKRIKVWHVFISSSVGGSVALATGSERIIDLHFEDNWGLFEEAPGEIPLFISNEGENLTITPTLSSSTDEMNVYVKYTVE